jgi:hypothetical protein
MQADEEIWLGWKKLSRKTSERANVNQGKNALPSPVPKAKKKFDNSPILDQPSPH